MPDLANDLSAEPEAGDSTTRNIPSHPLTLPLPLPCFEGALNMKRNFQIN